MFYRGGWNSQAVGRATSSDGVHWTKFNGNPVFGTADGVQGGQPWVHIDNSTGTMWLFTTENCCDPAKAHGVNIATATDGGFNWTQFPNVSVPLPACGSLFGNRVVWTEDGGGSSAVRWLMLQEIMCSPSGHGGPWQIFLYDSSNGIQWQLLNGGAALRSLQLHPDGMYGGPRFASVDGRLMPKWPRDGLYHLWFHAVNGSGNLPTDIYHAQSRDLLNWQVTSEPVLKHSGQGFEFDQVAGAVPLAVHGQAYMFYDGDNNVAGTCAIGLVTADARSLAEGLLS